MKLTTAHKILMVATIGLSAAIVAWGVFHFNKNGETAGAVLAVVGSLSGVSFGYYLMRFIKKN